MKFSETRLPGVLLIEPQSYADERGTFQEIWRESAYAEIGVGPFTQDNVSNSRKGVLRGLHTQVINPQGKLLYVLAGAVFDVAVDIRSDSSNFGRWFGTVISEENHHQLWIPPGFAHGFCVLSQSATVYYKCTSNYIADAQRSIRWDDPEIGIDWPVENPILLQKDSDAPLLRDSEFASPP
jgi:dTDP-4-dehydrorhamnose 3,5-epimerase